MSKSMIIALMLTLAFAVIYITSCVVHAQEEETYEILYPETSMVDGVPYQIFNEVQAREIRLVTVDAEVIEEEETEEEPKMTYYANLCLTAYIATGSPCADGVYPEVGYTVASNDPYLWHKWIYIEGVGDRYVHDTGGMDMFTLDIFMSTYDEAIQFGCKRGEVYIYE